jgi:hypothetical protein
MRERLGFLGYELRPVQSFCGRERPASATPQACGPAYVTLYELSRK